MPLNLTDFNDAQKALIDPKHRASMKITTAEERREKWEAGQEKELQQLISNWLAQQGDAVYVETDAFGRKTSGKAGRPDFRICYRGRWIGIEVKAEHGRLSPAQVATLEKIRKAGGIAIVAFGLDAVRDALRAIDGEVILRPLDSFRCKKCNEIGTQSEVDDDCCLSCGGKFSCGKNGGEFPTDPESANQLQERSAG